MIKAYIIKIINLPLATTSNQVVVVDIGVVVVVKSGVAAKDTKIILNNSLYKRATVFILLVSTVGYSTLSY